MNPIHSAVCSTVVSMCLWCAPACAQVETPPAPAEPVVRADLPDVTTIIEKSMEAAGGKERIRDLQSVHVIMDASLMGTDLTMESAWRRKGGRKLATTIGGQGSQQLANDGTVWWSHDPLGYSLVEDEDRRRSNDKQAEIFIAMLDPIFIAKQHNAAMRTIDRTTFENRDCYVIEIVNTENEKTHAHYDAETSLPIGMNAIQNDRITKVLFKDWKAVDGISIFHTIEVHDPGMPEPIVFKARSVTFNSLDASFFELPRKVKELAGQELPQTDADRP